MDELQERITNLTSNEEARYFIILQMHQVIKF